MTTTSNQRLDTLKRKKRFLQFFHYSLMLGPLIGFAIKGLVYSVQCNTAYKVVLPLMVSASILLAVIGLMIDIKYRAGLHKTIFWSMVLVISYSLQSVKAFLWILAVDSILDELLVRPLYHNCKQKLMVCKEVNRTLNQ